MFFAKTLFVLAAVSTSVLGHAAVSPALGVTGKVARADAQRPSTAKPCGNAALSAIDTSTAVPLSGNSFTVTATNFNAGRDGSTQFTAQVDTTGKGTAFKAATVTKNGVAAPTSTGDVQITVQMPAGTTCTGGAAGNLCLVSFKSAGGFGNCVVVSSGAAAAGAGATTTTGAAAGTAAGNAAAVKTGKKVSNKANNNRNRRHARDFLASIEKKREYTKRAISYVWVARDAA